VVDEGLSVARETLPTMILSLCGILSADGATPMGKLVYRAPFGCEIEPFPNANILAKRRLNKS
jgi:hypothetical protein